MAFPLNRRQLLGAGLAAAIPSAHAFIPVKVPQKWDDTVDVLCVGTGFSGLAAAIEAHNRRRLRPCHRQDGASGRKLYPRCRRFCRPRQ